MPYLYRNAIETSRTGVPVMRSMVLEYTEDKNCTFLDKQYFFGDSMLAAPIFNEESRAEFYLPKGIWTHFLTGKVYEGGQWYEEPCGYLSIPVFVKENSIIAVGGCEERPDYNYTEGLTLQVYELQEGTPAETVVYRMDTSVGVRALVEKKDGKIRIHAEGEHELQVRLVNVQTEAYQEAVADGKDTVLRIVPGQDVEVSLT